MRITEIRTTPLLIPYASTYYWAQGKMDGFAIILVEIHTDEGLVGYGECNGTPSAEAICSYLKFAENLLRGGDPFENTALLRMCYQQMFQLRGTNSAPRFSGQILAGLDMALWDLMGKATGKPVHQLLGGAVRKSVSYFGFAQGGTPEEIASQARERRDEGHEVIYIKAGQSMAYDLEAIRQTRAAIGPDARLRVDPNEHWGIAMTPAIMARLQDCNVEFVEQPTNCESIHALAHVRASSPVPVSADQAVFTPHDVFDVCKAQAADLIVLGLHETGGILQFLKAAHIAEAGGLNICLHGHYETGITTCATNQAAAVIQNLDDGNQYMNHFPAWDIISDPDLTLLDGQLGIIDGPGLGFEIHWGNVEQAAADFAKSDLF